MRQRRSPADMVSKLIIVRSRSSSLRITSQRNDEPNTTKDPNQRQATAKESLIRLKTEKTDCLGRSKKP